jgi:hypothetical protein
MRKRNVRRALTTTNIDAPGRVTLSDANPPIFQNAKMRERRLIQKRIAVNAVSTCMHASSIDVPRNTKRVKMKMLCRDISKQKGRLTVIGCNRNGMKSYAVDGEDRRWS